MHDSQGLQPLVRGIPPIRSRGGPRRRKPAKLHADKGHDYDHLRRWRRQRHYERKAEHFLAFVGIAAVLIGYRGLIR